MAQGNVLDLTRDHSLKYNFLTYTWPMAIMQPLSLLLTRARRKPPNFVVPHGLGMSIHLILRKGNSLKST
ncbi:MAG: hypothetical protein ACP5T2_05905 [Thermoprotei archaeon]